MAQQQGIYGVVRVRVALDGSGAIQDVVVVRTVSAVLNSTALQAARASTFAPARRHCANVPSAYEFRVLFAPDGPRVPLPPAPTPSPSPTPLPAPDLGKPWRLAWSNQGSYSFMDRTLTSSRSYTQTYDTFPISHRVQCRDVFSAPALQRVIAALRAARPEKWLGEYDLVVDAPTPPLAPVPTPTPTPAVDVVAMVRERWYPSGVMDAATGQLTLVAGGITYNVHYQSGAGPGTHETLPQAISELTGVLSASIPQRCKTRP